jgi:hypothetical protein
LWSYEGLIDPFLPCSPSPFSKVRNNLEKKNLSNFAKANIDELYKFTPVHNLPHKRSPTKFTQQAVVCKYESSCKPDPSLKKATSLLGLRRL